MNTTKTVLGMALALALPSLGAAAYVDPNTGLTWRNLSETTGVSWTQVNNLTRDANGVFAAGQSINGVDFSGWTWATLADVDVLLDELTNGFNAAGEFDYKTETDSVWAPVAVDQVGPTFSIAGVVDIATGWTSTLNVIDSGRALLVTIIDDYGGGLVDVADDATSRLVDFSAPDTGVWLYKSPTPVPLPAALPLFAAALAMFGWLGRRQMVG